MTAAARRRWVLLCAIGVAVVALHMATLLLLGPAWLDPQGPIAATPPMHVRSVVLPTLAMIPVPPVPPVPPPAAAAPVQRPRPARAPVAASLPLPPAQGHAEPLAPGATELVEVPVYATRLPPAGQWRYRLQRGLLVGEADLHWAPQADARYELRLYGRVAGVTLLEWISLGLLDAAGVAPERFAVRRRGRDAQAANFQREAGKISFSGPTHEVPLLAGAQDRLSWMLQLPAVVAAAPERFTAGARIVLFVAGARGDADVWTFVVHGIETLGETPTLKLVREPRKPYDLRAEVWLDPAEHYIPLRAVQTPAGGGAALELLRER